MDTTVEKAFKVLELLAGAGGDWGVTDVANRLSLTRSNAHRLLSTLVALGYLQTASGRYSVNLKLWEMGSRIVSRLDLRAASAAAVNALASHTGETVHVSLLSGSDVVCIHQIDCLHQVRPHDGVGSRAPAYCVATGKAILAFQPDAIRDPIIAGAVAHTLRTLTTQQDFEEEFRRIQKTGVALNKGEFSSDVLGAAAPIHDASGAVTAAIGVSIPVTRCTVANLTKFLPPLIEAGATISRSLGYIPEMDT